MICLRLGGTGKTLSTHGVPDKNIEPLFMKVYQRKKNAVQYNSSLFFKNCQGHEDKTNRGTILDSKSKERHSN